MVKPILKAVGGFAAVAFLLLGILFGMQIMTFIFSQLNPAATSSFASENIQVTNETGAWLNSTTYVVDAATRPGFANLVITAGLNVTDNSSITPANFTVSGNSYTNGSVSNWGDVWVSYTYDRHTEARNAVDTVNNNSLQGIVSYTGQSSTQMTTVAIAITLAVLIALFLLFWVFFIKGKGTGKDMAGGNFG